MKENYGLLDRKYDLNLKSASTVHLFQRKPFSSVKKNSFCVHIDGHEFQIVHCGGLATSWYRILMSFRYSRTL